jgi:hypothetical protein
MPRRSHARSHSFATFTQWAQREDYENYLAWRTETGFRGEMNELLTEPQTFTLYDDIVSLIR